MWRQNVLNQVDTVETIPKTYRLSPTPIERNIDYILITNLTH